MKQIKKLLSFLLVLALVLGYVPAAVFAEGLSEEDKAEIVVSFELYDDKADQVALLFGPKAVEIEEGDNGKIIAERLLGAENVGISDTGYMESFTIDETEYSPATMELTYGSWLVYKNNSQDGVGPAEYVPADGDVYRFVLTSYDPVTYAMPTLGNDMDALYWAMAKSGADLTSANQLVQSAAPSQADIDAMAVSLSNPGEKHYIIIDQRTVQVDTTSYPYTYTETLSVDKLTAQAGEMVTVTVVAPEGLVLKEGSLKANGTALTKAEDGTYTFEMPDAHVSITAEFEADDSTKLLTAEFFLDEEGTKPVAMDPEFDKDVNEYKVDVLDQDLEEDLYFKATFNEGTTAQWQYYMEYSGYGFYSDGPEVVSGEIYGHSTANMLYPGMTNGMKHKIDVKSASGLLNEYFFTTTLYPTLASLAVNGEELPEFDYDTFEYEIEVPEGTEEITLCATPYDEDTYYVYIDGDDEDAAGADTTVAVTDGQEISVVVDDDNGTTKEYTLTVKIVAVPKLADLQFRFGSSATSALYVMEPVFDPNVFEYTIYVPDYTTNVYGFATLISGSEGTITAAYTNTSGAATTKTLTSGAASGVSFNGLVKSNDFTPGSDIVISINGTERYTVHVARQATLAAGTSGFSLKVDDASITLTPAYNRTVYEYDVNLPADAELSLTAKPTVASASLTVNGSEAQASTAMDIIPVWTDHGFDIVVEVSAEAVMSGVYTIHVHETPTELEIVASPAKIVYATGDEFDPAGMEVHAHYADGDTVNVPLEDLSFSPSGALRFSDTVITVSYNGATAEQPISFMAPFEGEGTEEDPFRIEDLEDMYTLDVYVENGESFAGTYLIMTDDIALDSAFNGVGFGNNFGGTASGYNANTCKGFSGDFNGDGHTLTVAAGGRAPFDLVRDGCVHDLNLYGEQIDDNGLVSTYIANGGSVELKNIVVKSGTKILKSGLIGGYGNKPLTISYCTVEEGVIVGYKKDQLWIGGIAGEFNGTIKNCSCDAEVYGVSFVGGIVADKGQSMQTFVVENCKFGGKVVASGEGFVLEDYPNNSMVKNFVPGSYAGGIVGAGYGGTQWGMNSAWSCPGVTIKNCEFTGTVEGSIAVGGILGGEGAQAQAWDNGHTVIQDNISRGKVSGEKFVGGNIGYMISLNKNSDISGNKYNSEYNAVGIGGVGGIDTAGHEAGFAEDGTFYFCTKVDDTNTAALIRDTVPGTALTNVVSIATLGSAGYKNQWKTDHQREDDPLGADAYDLCAPLELEVKELTIVNNTGMFKGVSAHLEVTPAGETTLVFALSGTGYHYLYRGTYEEAVENGDNRENWIAGYLNDAGKWEFRVSVSGDDNEMIPLVAISQPYLEKYEAGQNPLERAFYPRQADLNIDDLVVTFDDYHRYTGLSITNNVEDFDVEDAMITTIGGPNSNGYAATLQLILGSDAFDQAYFGSAEEAAAADTTIAVNAEDHSVEIKLMWIVTAGDPSSIVSYLGEDVVISFHSAEDGKWHEMIFNANEADATLVISAEEPSDDVNVNLPEGYPLEEGTDYSVDGNVITVTHETPCKVGYYDEEQGRYVEIEAQPVEGEENTYTFTAPEGVTDVVIVVKGDATLDGSVNLGDAARIKAFYRHKTDLDALEMFAADINSDGSVNLGDASKITAVFRKKTTVDW